MGELELRIAALETAFIELGAWLDPDALDDAERSIRAGLGRGDGDEQTARLGAIQLIDDARKRFRPDFPTGGLAAYATR
jgi:hypothetical protein